MEGRKAGRQRRGWKKGSWHREERVKGEREREETVAGWKKKQGTLRRRRQRGRRDQFTWGDERTGEFRPHTAGILNTAAPRPDPHPAS